MSDFAQSGIGPAMVGVVLEGLPAAYGIDGLFLQCMRKRVTPFTMVAIAPIANQLAGRSNRSYLTGPGNLVLYSRRISMPGGLPNCGAGPSEVWLSPKRAFGR